jgi:putative FmdB family regulatory protein
MTTREYECPNCGPFEYKHKITDESLTQCPKCGAEVRRVFAAMPKVWWVGWPYLRDSDLGPDVHG